MEPIDAAFEKLKSLSAEIAGYADTVESEADTRLKVIDRILTQVLGWSLNEIKTEEQAGAGYVDYRLSCDGLARLILEAKKDGAPFGLASRHEGRAYKLGGAVFRKEPIKPGIEQAIRYCGHKNAELACVTNGHEWVVFRGSRLGDGRDTLDGMAFVFPSVESVERKFSLFYDLLSHEAVSERKFRAHFQEAEGQPIRPNRFSRSLATPADLHVLSRDSFANDIDKVMTSFFRRLSGDDDPQLLANCFVETQESKLAENRLARISEDLVTRVQGLNTADPGRLTQVIQRVVSTQRNEFVILIGTKGAGKSTFIDRFFTLVLPEDIAERCVPINVNLADSNGDESRVVDWLDQHLVSEAERTVFGESGPGFDDLQAMFFDEYRRWMVGPYKPLYQKDKDQFKLLFGQHVEERREQRTHEYVCRLVRSIIALRQKVPCVILDNADHFSITFQERVFQYARSIYEQEVCLVIVPITDRTSWELSKHGALQSFDSESLYLPTPSPKTIMQKRVSFLEDRVAEEEKAPGRGYFFSRGIELSLENLKAFAACLAVVFLQSGRVAKWIGNLANHDIRRCLELVRNIVSSSHLKLVLLLKAYIAKSAIVVDDYHIRRAIIRGKYNLYPMGQHKFVQNIYALHTEMDTSPLLGLRLLQLLRDVQYKDAEGAKSFIPVSQVIDYFRAMTFEPTVVLLWLNEMLKTGLCFAYDPTAESIDEGSRIELTPAGLQHLHSGTADDVYISSMLLVTPITDRNAFEKLKELNHRSAAETWRQKLVKFVEYLLFADAMYCKVPDHEAYTGQNRVLRTLDALKRRYLSQESGTPADS